VAADRFRQFNHQIPEELRLENLRKKCLNRANLGMWVAV
jgi:hypothetical protein